MSEVCIIGAGMSGIIASKVSLSNNLIPYILEKSDSIGGVWKASPTQVGVWNSLLANTSKYFLVFSDHPWPAETPTYPTHTHFVTYMNSYIEKHGMRQYIHFNTQVTLISKNGEGFDVTFKKGDETETKYFKYVICATGFYSRIKDQFENKEKFKGQIIHSGYYREPSELAGKNVVVVGKAFSAGDISEEVSKCARSVTQLYKNPTICIRRVINGIPNDFLMFSIDSRHHQGPLTATLERNSEFVRMMFEFVGNPGEILDEWLITEEDLRTRYVNFSNTQDDYLEAVRNKQIQCVRGEMKGFCENGIELTDGRVLEADAVILATGYYPDYSYFSEELQEILDYDKNNQKVALTLYRATIHPALPTLGFVGSFHGPFPGQFELQSELSVKWITGQLNVSVDELWEGVRLEKRCRTELVDSIFIYDFGMFLQEYFRILEIKIDYEFLESLGYKNGIYSSLFYWKERSGQEEIIREFVKEITSSYPAFRFN